jgi:hypothetical protein
VVWPERLQVILHRSWPKTAMTLTKVGTMETREMGLGKHLERRARVDELHVADGAG